MATSGHVLWNICRRDCPERVICSRIVSPIFLVTFALISACVVGIGTAALWRDRHAFHPFQTPCIQGDSIYGACSYINAHVSNISLLDRQPCRACYGEACPNIAMPSNNTSDWFINTPGCRCLGSSLPPEKHQVCIHVSMILDTPEYNGSITFAESWSDPDLWSSLFVSRHVGSKDWEMDIDAFKRSLEETLPLGTSMNCIAFHAFRNDRISTASSDKWSMSDSTWIPKQYAICHAPLSPQQVLASLIIIFISAIACTISIVFAVHLSHGKPCCHDSEESYPLVRVAADTDTDVQWKKRSWDCYTRTCFTCFMSSQTFFYERNIMLSFTHDQTWHCHTSGFITTIHRSRSRMSRSFHSRSHMSRSTDRSTDHSSTDPRFQTQRADDWCSGWFAHNCRSQPRLRFQLEWHGRNWPSQDTSQTIRRSRQCNTLGCQSDTWVRPRGRHILLIQSPAGNLLYDAMAFLKK